MSYFFQIWTKEDFLSLFGKIWIEIHVTLESSIISLNQVITQFICRCAYVMCNREKDVLFANSLALQRMPATK